MAKTYPLPSGTFVTETGRRTEVVAGVAVNETTTATTTTPPLVVVMA